MTAPIGMLDLSSTLGSTPNVKWALVWVGFLIPGPVLILRLGFQSGTHPTLVITGGVG
jgi:hypothetical protein